MTQQMDDVVLADLRFPIGRWSANGTILTWRLDGGVTD